MKKQFAILALLIASSAAHAAGATIDVKAIAGKSKQKVATVLGTPRTCSPSKYGEKCSYEKAETEIVFINGKADWMTVEALDSVPYDDRAITSLGLKAAKPKFKNEFTIRWELVEGLIEVSIFPAGSKVDYAYIKVSTK